MTIVNGKYTHHQLGKWQLVFVCACALDDLIEKWNIFAKFVGSVQKLSHPLLKLV